MPGLSAEDAPAARRGRPSMRPGPKSSHDPGLMLRNLYWAWLNGAPVKSPLMSVRKIAAVEGYSPQAVCDGIQAGRELERLLSRVPPSH